MRLLLLLALTGTWAAAQVATPVVTEKMRRGREIVDEAIAALGGDNFLNLKTKIEKGRVFSFYNQQLSGLSRATVYTKYLIAPDPPRIEEFYLRERQAFGKDEKWSVIFNEDDGFEVTFRGARPMSEEAIKEYRTRRRRDIFYILLRRLNEPGMIYERITSDVVDNKPVEVVDITDGDNEVVTVNFHYSTKLPERQVYSRRGKDRIRRTETTIWDKYRDVGGGIMLPYVFQRHKDGVQVFSMFADSVEANVPLGEEIIGLPANIKVLKRQQ